MAEIAARFIAFAATAYVSQVVGAAAFGVVSVALAALLYAHRLASWELEAVGVQEVAGDDALAGSWIRTLLLARLASAIGVAGFVALLSLLVLPQPDGRVLMLYSVGLCFVALNARFVYLMRQQPARPAIARLLTEAVAAGVLILAVRSATDLTRIPLAYIAGEATAAALLWFGLRTPAHRTHGVFDFSFAARVGREAWPLVLSSLLGLLVFNLDLILLRFSRGAEAAGYYAAAYALVSLLLNLGVTYYANVLPGLSRLRGDRVAFETLHRDATVLVIALFLPLVVGGALLASNLIQLVFGSEYAPAAAPLVPLFVSAGLTVARFVPLATVVALGARRQALWINGSGAVVNVALNLALIPRYGMMGAATATVITDVVRLAVAYHLCLRAGLSLAHLHRLWRPVLASTAMALVVWLLRDRSLLLTISVGGVAYLATLVAVGGIRLTRAMRPQFTC